MDPKLGILHFLPKARIAGGEGPGAVDLKFKGYTSAPPFTAVSIQNMSDLAAELGASHLDIGKTMGIRRVILDVVDGQRAGFNVKFVVGENEAAGGAFSAWHGSTSQGPTDQDYIDVAALVASLDPAFVHSGNTEHAEFGVGQFLLLNLNYKSPVAQTPAGNVRWTFPSQAGREAAGIYSTNDIGKVAKQTDEQSWWVLERTEPVPNSTNVKPIWGSQDRQSQIAAGCFTNRVVLFFQPDGDGTASPFYPFINEFGAFRTTGNPLRDKKDQRALYDVFGDERECGWSCNAHQFNHPAITDPIIGVKNFNQAWWKRPYLGDIGLFSSFEALEAAAASFTRKHVGRFAVYIDETDEMPYHLQVLEVDPVVFSPFQTYPIVVRATPYTDHPFTYHELPDGDPPNNYGGEGNPELQGGFRVRDACIQARAFITEFRNTD